MPGLPFTCPEWTELLTSKQGKARQLSTVIKSTLQAETRIGMIAFEAYLLGYIVVQSVESQPTFRWNNLLHLQGRKINEVKNQREVGSRQCLLASCLTLVSGCVLCSYPRR
jgi:hypothetical protein